MTGYGPLWRVDGPPPSPPLYGLLRAAEAPATGVRIVVETAMGEMTEAEYRALVDAGVLPAEASLTDHWLNGVEIFPYPEHAGGTYDTCAPGSTAHPKDFGDPVVTNPTFGPLTVYLPETCTASHVLTQDEFRARAIAALAAVESRVVAHELLTGAELPLQPHLQDGHGTFPTGNTVTSVPNAIALLEGEISKSGRQGLIHMSPLALTIAAAGYLIRDTTTGVLRTIKGTVVIPDDGYVAGVGSGGPSGKTPASGTQEWMYATGPIDIRRSEIFVVPETLAQALDRGTGATNSRPNSITYRAERYYIAGWDTAVQAAVLADRCKTTC